MMKEVSYKIGKRGILDAAEGVLSSRPFPFFTATVMLICTYLSLDLVMFWYMAVVTVAMLLLLDDLSPLVGQFLFFNVMMSEENSPSALLHRSDFLLQPAVWIQIIVLGCLLLAAVVCRFVVSVRAGAFRSDGIFRGLCALSVFLLLNGAGAAGYTPLNLAYGAVMAFAFVGVYALMSANVRRTEQSFCIVGWTFAAFSLLLLVELSVCYARMWDSIKDFLNDGSLYDKIKSHIVFGWGNWNTMGMLLSICVPPIFLLASKFRHGWLLDLYASLVALGALLSFSRQAQFAAVLCFLLSAVITVVKGKRRPLHIATVVTVLLIAAVLLIAKREWVAELFRRMLHNLFNDQGDFTGNARMRLLKGALAFFVQNPVFGSGFFVDFGSYGAADFTNVSLMPLMAHNTFGELIAVGGMGALLFYCLHRVQTVIAFAAKPTADKLYFAVTLSAILVMSLVDNHIFYILPTMVYSSFLAFICKQ